MKFQLSAMVLLGAISQFSIAEMPNMNDTTHKGLSSLKVTQPDSNKTNSVAEPVRTDAGTLPSAIGEVADSLESKLEQRLQESVELGALRGNEVASAH